MASRNVESTLETLVIALCLDYRRRQSAIESGSAPRRTDVEYRYYNFKIYDAVSEIAGERLADRYIDEIGQRVGYAKSSIACVSETIYKQYKRLIINNIAKKLHLC